ncbi:type IV toxin-antitoxin system AbiEi family antitoxin domain-containing protein [Nocardioides bizhenqiangii]|uniref:Type IV toxin-antitoxin system AbiEi family antitoxin domain-containing protein n=1 Tax=Nocardioides bizhenqiangii TaxID=3095076 RepID=A0ABZ0ZSJ8_9ACTN|nr:type IV toxin-antitoxin system AbiEi family antitoxin domain-containing protein [Nocardioides sp. HM61]WQQ26886.1 type IV toxin-antitoxin system AbiEi family antitoxin domain-containing protein [Nocardioides sp. HM61]
MTDTPDIPDGPFTTEDAKGRGITRHTLRRMVREGVVRRVTAGVYAAAALEDTVELRARALALVLAPHQVVCDRTAAWLYGIDLFTSGDLDVLPEIETCAWRGNGPCRRKEVDGRTRDLHNIDVTTIEGVQVTTPLRTALDLACLLERRDALAALDAFRRREGLTLAQLLVGSQRYRRRRGVVQQRELIPLSDPRAESTRESWTRLAIHDEGLPTPDLQVWVEVGGVPTYRLDLAYRRRRIAVEYDGWEAHESTPEQREATRARRKWLRDHGWTVIVVRNGDFTGPALERWLGELKDALASSYSNRRRLERGSRC